MMVFRDMMDATTAIEPLHHRSLAALAPVLRQARCPRTLLDGLKWKHMQRLSSCTVVER